MAFVNVSHATLFNRQVKDCMDAAPPQVSSGMSCREVVGVLRKHGTSLAVVTDGAMRFLGIVTDRDISHRVAYRAPPTTPVNELMTRAVYTVGEDDYVFQAIATMRRRALRHLPVVDRGGRLSGIVHLHKALAQAMPRFMDLVERLSHDKTLNGLQKFKRSQIDVVESLAADRVPFSEIQRLLTHMNNDVYRRMVDIALNDMQDEGWGRPPVRFEVIVMGSGGRGESFLFPDQDNGFITQDYSPNQHTTVDRYFYELARRMTRGLDSVGFALCRGHVMATNPLWRKSISEWRHQLGFWLRRPHAATLRLSDIFFDFSPVYGAGDLAETLREHVAKSVMKHHPFLQEMQRVQSDHGVALGLLGRLAPDPTDGPHRGELNLKYHALLPLVEAVRLLALRQGLRTTSTLGRISALHLEGVLDENEQDYMSGTLHYLTELVLRQQLRDARGGRAASAYVSLHALSEREKDLLVTHLQAVNALRERVREIFTAQVF